MVMRAYGAALTGWTGRRRTAPGPLETPGSPSARDPLNRGSNLAQACAVHLRALHVAPGDAQKVILVFLRQAAHDLARRAEHQHAIGDFLSLGDERIGADQRALADARSVHHDAVDADEAAVADRSEEHTSELQSPC